MMSQAFLKLNRNMLLSALGSAALAIAGLAAQAQTTPAPSAPAQAAPAPATAPAATPQAASTLTIKITGVRNTNGKIGVVLYGSEKGFPMDPSNAVAMKLVEIDPQTKTATVVFANLPQGTYAATVLHDEKLIGKMEFDSQGIPLEGYGISNNPDSQSAPTWDTSKFVVNQPEVAIDIAMIYWQ
jgi:uncharacterized protein (DUF2141 family)